MGDTSNQQSLERSYRRLTSPEIGLLYRLHLEGLTQTQIAQRLGCNQTTVGEWIRNLTDTTDVAKARVRAKALDLVDGVIEKGRPSDWVAMLKGTVLQGDVSSGVTIHIGGKDSDLNLFVSNTRSEVIDVTPERRLTGNTDTDAVSDS